MTPGKLYRVRRDWMPARLKVENEGSCRNCGGVTRLEAAHVLGQKYDHYPPLNWPAQTPWTQPFTVVANRVIPLCGPSNDSTTCHGKDHKGLLDKLKLLTVDEQLQAVADAGGLESARSLLVPRAQRDGVVLIARCPVHGLHGERHSCHVCNGPVDQVPMREAA